MLLPVLYGFLVLSLVYLYSYLFKAVKRKLPQGAREAPVEPGLPFIGVIHKIKLPMHHFLLNLGPVHGNIFRIKIGMREMFVLNDYLALKAALKDDGDNFSGRWNGHFMKKSTKNTGILLIDGDVWAKQRSFMLRVLRDFGMGRSKTEEIVSHECAELLEGLRRTQGLSVDFADVVTWHTVNIISQFLMRKRYSKGDADIDFVIKFMRRILGRQNLLQVLHMMVPAWDNSAWCSKVSFKLLFRPHEFDKITKIITTEIEEHRKCLDATNEGEDFIDRFLIEQAQLAKRNGNVESFTDYQLVRTTFEMLAAGFDSTSMTLTWSLLFLSKHADVQERMHTEIVNTIGLDKMVTTSDRKLLPYTEAVIDEILRLSSVSPLAVFHRNFHDTVVNGIFIPRNSFILPNLYGCHRDSSVWEKPFEFYPEHFLQLCDDGTLKYRPREELLPFSLGKRQCLGESLARAEVFVFLTSIVQQFRVTFACDVTERQYQENLLGDQAPVRYPKIRDFIFHAYSTSHAS